jgi:GxxExxY protein
MARVLDNLEEDSWPACPDAWNGLTRQVIGCAIEVHRHLGPGLPEKLYEAALLHEIRTTGLAVRQQHPVRVQYKSIALPELVIDLLVEDLLALELRVVEKVADVHLAQLVSYLRAARLPIGLLINFNAPTLKSGIFRQINSESAERRSSGVSHSASEHSALSAASAFNSSERP